MTFQIVTPGENKERLQHAAAEILDARSKETAEAEAMSAPETLRLRLLPEHQLWVLSGTEGPAHRPRPDRTTCDVELYFVFCCRRPPWNYVKA